MYTNQQAVLAGKRVVVNVKTHSPYAYEDEVAIYLNPNARARYQPDTKTWAFETEGKPKQLAATEGARSAQSSPTKAHRRTSAPPTPVPAPVLGLPLACPVRVDVPPQESDAANGNSDNNNNNSNGHARTSSFSKSYGATAVELAMQEVALGLKHPLADRGVGVDVQEVAGLSNDPDFLKRNFTEKEIAYCSEGNDQTQIRARFAGRWAAKEAVIKALSSSAPLTDEQGNLWKGSGAPVKGIEILPSRQGPPRVILYDHAANVAALLGIREVKVTISHSGDYAVAQAVAR